MRKVLKRLFISVGLVLLVVGLLTGWAYLASQQVPDFYAQATEHAPADQDQKCDAFLTEATELYSELQQAGRWQAVFTAEEINSWLAVDVVKNHAQSLPPGVSEPRIALTEGGAKLACRYETPRFTTILSLQLDAYLAEPNVIGLRFRKARAGALPLPLADILESLAQEANKHNVPVRWLQADGDPVALISMPSPGDKQKLVYAVDTLEIGPQGIYVSGSSSPRVAQSAPPPTVPETSSK